MNKKHLVAAAATLLLPAAMQANTILYQTVIVYPQSTVYLTPETTKDSYLFALPFYAQQEALGLILSTGNNPCYVACFAHVEYPNSYPPAGSNAPEPATAGLLVLALIAGLVWARNQRKKK